MTRCPNVSDGLVHLEKRKIIFTTNQNGFRGVDPALIGPGRCFGAVKARPLSYEEACAAASDASLPLPPDLSFSRTCSTPGNRRGLSGWVLV